MEHDRVQRTRVGDVETAHESVGSPGDTPLLLVMGHDLPPALWPEITDRISALVGRGGGARRVTGRP